MRVDVDHAVAVGVDADRATRTRGCRASTRRTRSRRRPGGCGRRAAARRRGRPRGGRCGRRRRGPRRARRSASRMPGNRRLRGCPDDTRPPARAARCTFFDGAGLTHRVAHPTRAGVRRPIRAATALRWLSPSAGPLGRAARRPSALAVRRVAGGPVPARRRPGAPAPPGSPRRSPIASAQAPTSPTGTRRPASPTTSGQRRRVGGHDRRRRRPSPRGPGGRSPRSATARRRRRRARAARRRRPRGCGRAAAPAAAAAGLAAIWAATALSLGPTPPGRTSTASGCADEHPLEGAQQRRVLLVGVGDRRVQHHRPVEAVALDQDVARGAERADGHGVRDDHHLVRGRLEPLEHGAAHELARHGHPSAAAHGGRAPPVAGRGASATSGWPCASSGCRSWSVSTAGAERRRRHRAAGVVHEVEVRRCGRRASVDSAAMRRPADAAVDRCHRRCGARRPARGRPPRRPGSTKSRRSRSSAARSSSPRTVATVDCSLPPTSPGTSHSRLMPTVIGRTSLTRRRPGRRRPWRRRCAPR